MDEILNKMSTAAVISGESKNNYEDLYKNWGRLGSQEERRKQVFEKQKSNRNSNLDTYRGILELVSANEEKECFSSKKKGHSHYRPSIYVAGFSKASDTYRNVLMESEWLVDKPSDFSEEWYVVPCPKGSRMLVISNEGKTRCYNKMGRFRRVIGTALPGGSHFNPRYGKTCCALDCFYNEGNNTLYVLDFLIWNNQPMTDCDTEFRHFWLESQIAEIPELSQVSKINETKFVLLPKVPCTTEKLNNFMMTYPHFNDGASLDGLLFYHKKAHYVSGETPLVGWLFPYMVQEVLGMDITVHKCYMQEKPDNYTNQLDYILKFDCLMAMKKHVKSNTSKNSTKYSMETTDTAEVETSNTMEAEVVGCGESSKNNEGLENNNNTNDIENLDTD